MLQIITKKLLEMIKENILEPEKVRRVLNDALEQLDRRIYENIITQTNSRGFSSRRSVEDTLKMFELKKCIKEMIEEYKNK